MVFIDYLVTILKTHNTGGKNAQNNNTKETAQKSLFVYSFSNLKSEMLSYNIPL